MIRNVVLGRLHDDADLERLDEALEAMRHLQVEGMLAMTTGRDAGLRPGNWSYSIVADFVDAAAYRRYDEEAEHNRLRREYFGPLSGDIARCQFEV